VWLEVVAYKTVKSGLDCLKPAGSIASDLARVSRAAVIDCLASAISDCQIWLTVLKMPYMTVKSVLDSPIWLRLSYMCHIRQSILVLTVFNRQGASRRTWRASRGRQSSRTLCSSSKPKPVLHVSYKTVKSGRLSYICHIKQSNLVLTGVYTRI